MPLLIRKNPSSNPWAALAMLDGPGNLASRIRTGESMIRALDVFCGAGGSSAGARSGGAEIAAGIDLSPLATETFKSNFPDALAITARLEEINLGWLKRRIGPIDLLLASPECTNHTCARGSAPRDESSRATAMLVVEYARLFKPRWLVLENVVHMRPWSRYGELKTELHALGYHLDEQVLDSSNFGVPQKRRRLFIVGDRKQKPALVRRKPSKECPRAAKTILDPSGTWATTPLFRDGRAKGTLERAQRAFEALGEGKSFLLVYYGTDGGGGWQRLDKPLRTITTVDRFALVTPSAEGHSMRMLQVPELKRAMGYNDSFKFPTGTRRDRIRLLGNGVCPPVMRAVVRALTVA
jgi:DNA (cytosine-5)-methyltransferase 1